MTLSGVDDMELLSNYCLSNDCLTKLVNNNGTDLVTFIDQVSKIRMHDSDVFEDIYANALLLENVLIIHNNMNCNLTEIEISSLHTVEPCGNYLRLWKSGKIDIGICTSAFNVNRIVYARHGRELMGCKSPVRESSHCRETG